MASKDECEKLLMAAHERLTDLTFSIRRTDERGFIQRAANNVALALSGIDASRPSGQPAMPRQEPPLKGSYTRVTAHPDGTTTSEDFGPPPNMGALAMSVADGPISPEVRLILLEAGELTAAEELAKREQGKKTAPKKMTRSKRQTKKAAKRAKPPKKAQDKGGK